MVWNHVRVRILGPGLWALICPGLLNRGVGQKLWYPQCPFFFPVGEISLPWLEKYRILVLLVVGNGGSLMLMCSNARIIGGFSIFGNTFNAAFWGFPQVQNPYKKAAR